MNDDTSMLGYNSSAFFDDIDQPSKVNPQDGADLPVLQQIKQNLQIMLHNDETVAVLDETEKDFTLREQVRVNKEVANRTQGILQMISRVEEEVRDAGRRL